MKLIATKDFRNVPSLRLKDKDGKSLVKGAKHDDVIHKGALFELGTGNTLDDLRKKDPANALLVAQLVVSGCVGDASDARTVEAVQAEIEAEEKREANARKLDATAAAADLGQRVVAQLKGK